MCKFIKILFLLVLMVGCTALSQNQQLLEQAENIIEESPDSSLKILKTISMPTLKKKEAALYSLLLTQASHRLELPITSDSLISQSVLFYSHSRDNLHYARSLYYKGVVLYQLNKKEEATLCLKQVETLVGKLDDEVLKNKLYEMLHIINHQSHNYDLALHYSRLFIKSSQSLNNKKWLCRAYNATAMNFKVLKMNDSAAYYRRKCMEIADQDTANISYYYTGFANDLFEQGEYAEAERYLQKAIQQKPLPNHYLTLGKIALKRGDTAQARRHWEHAITIGQSGVIQHAYARLSELAAQRGDLRQALALRDKADSALLAYSKQTDYMELAMVQKEHDDSMAEQKQVSRKEFWLKMALVALAIAAALLMVVLHYRRKVEKYRSAVNQEIEQMNEARKRIEFLESTGEDYAQEIDTLRRQVSLMKEATAAKLGSGKEVYEKILAGSMTDFDTTKEQAFVDYFAFTNPLDFARMCAPYKTPTLRQTTYLVLQHIGLDDQQIQMLLGVSGSTIRSYRHRLKKNT